nr:hypothetical protein B0A51_15212 [Rachicladosporium sp. CCFEE 5018]
MQTRMPYRQKYQQRPETQQWRKKRQQQEVFVKPWWAIEEDGQPAMMLCGVHMRPKSYSALKHPVGDPKRYLWASAEDKRYRRALGAGEKRGSCLCDYTYYSKLLGEREMADQTVSHLVPNIGEQHTLTFQQIKPSFLLMRLPAELRDEVYRQMLVSPGGVEICPTPYVRAPTRKCRNRGENCESYFKSTVQAEEYQRNSKWETIGQFAGIMRANKQVHKEASRICYSENEFRFTNTTGWMGLDTFLYQIDLRNCSMLRSITVRHADLLNLPCTCSSGSTFWDGILIRAHLGDRFNRVRWFDADDFDLKGLLSDAASCL